MPLKGGKSAVKSNIRELMHKFKESGKIGTSHPGSTKKAMKQAAAIAFRKSREG